MTRALYASLQDVKNYATAVGSSTNAVDALINQLLISESAFIDNELNVPISQGTYTETYDGEGGSLIAPRCFPITAVTGVSVDGVVQTLWDQANPTLPGFSFNRRFITGKGLKFTEGFQNVTISYTAGFAVVPDDIKQACIELVAYRLEERKRLGKASQTLNGETITFTDLATPPVVMARIQSYKSYVLTGGV